MVCNESSNGFVIFFSDMIFVLSLKLLTKLFTWLCTPLICKMALMILFCFLFTSIIKSNCDCKSCCVVFTFGFNTTEKFNTDTDPDADTYTYSYKTLTETQTGKIIILIIFIISVVAFIYSFRFKVIII